MEAPAAASGSPRSARRAPPRASRARRVPPATPRAFRPCARPSSSPPVNWTADRFVSRTLPRLASVSLRAKALLVVQSGSPLFRQPGGFEGFGRSGVVTDSDQAAALELVHGSLDQFDRDTAPNARCRLTEYGDDTVVPGVDHLLHFNRPALEVISPNPHEFNELFASPVGPESDARDSV